MNNPFAFIALFILLLVVIAISVIEAAVKHRQYVTGSRKYCQCGKELARENVPTNYNPITGEPRSIIHVVKCPDYKNWITGLSILNDDGTKVEHNNGHDYYTWTERLKR
jgi:hypothetical protein